MNYITLLVQLSMRNLQRVNENTIVVGLHARSGI